MPRTNRPPLPSSSTLGAWLPKTPRTRGIGLRMAEGSRLRHFRTTTFDCVIASHIITLQNQYLKCALSR